MSTPATESPAAGALRSVLPPRAPSPTDLLTMREAADLMRVSITAVRTLIRTGVLRAYRFGKLVRIYRSDLLAALQPIGPKDTLQENDGEGDAE